ncbi:tRNA nucleotidyltransferase (CCA-adding enzyme) [Pullulanibacillus pueri]|uniref:CCA-adding enzyme n=1 Tax=Pullulanibacillus pueri TaxID=1437324 RepID=A0A8J2ZUQ8_9BACL|nr:tRNA nucleotidyltransferase (CCA-adding enzyme) [Pullulanibacillus pueri]GGH78878.1 CCA-adding enzyme [Pullulanibacillus pueri]
MKNRAIEQANAVLYLLERAHYQAYIVGGAVRNLLLDLPIHDVDIATSAEPDEVMSLFQVTFPVGIEHGTVVVRYDHVDYEVTTFRSESEYKDFRHPEQVRFVTSLEKDLARRDFTVNAIAMNREGTLIDPYNGQADIQRQVLRSVGKASERFEEDPLRILRAARFVAQLNFSPDVELKQAMQAKNFRIRKLSVERIYQEMTKLLAGRWAAKGLHLLMATGVFSELPLLCHQSPKQNHEVVKIDYRECSSDAERWAAFLLSLDIKDVKAFLKAWRFSRKNENQVQFLIKQFKVFTKKEWDAYAVYQVGIENVRAIERLKKAFHLRGEGQKQCAEAYNERLPIHSRKELKVNGNDLQQWLGRKPGPWIQEWIIRIEAAVVKGQLVNDRVAIKGWVESCHKQKKKF